jgi:hypoxanthine phosphoribosyltransferase
MYTKTSKLEPVPDWVDKDMWKSYKNEYESEHRIYRFVDIVGIPFERITRKIYKAGGKIDWNGVDYLIGELAKKIKGNYEPDYVLGIERAGALIVNRFAEKIDIDPKNRERVGKIGISHYRHPLSRRIVTKLPFMLFSDAWIESSPEMETEGGKVLLFDSDLATGKTIKCGKKYLMDKGAADVKSAVLCGNDSGFARWQRKIFFGTEEPDFSVSEKAYMNYPWYRIKGELR